MPALLSAITQIVEDNHRNRGCRDWPRDTVDWLRNRRARDEDVDLLIASNRITHHLRFRRSLRVADPKLCR